MKNGLLGTLLAIAIAALPIAQAQADAASLGAWQGYALSEVTPDFDWAGSNPGAALEPTVLSVSGAVRTSIMPDLHFVDLDEGKGLAVAVSRTFAGDSPMFESGGLSARSVTAYGSGLERTLVAPSISYELGSERSISGAVVLAYQQFATWGLGSSAFEEPASSLPSGFTESSFGSGVRLQFEQRVSPSVGFSTAFQSKIDMDAFQSYRGVYSDPGDFDLPAVASAGIDFSLSPRNVLGFGVARVMYSEISPFTSNALPTRFLSLLGDGAAPVFEWQDLTVYSVDWTWQASARDHVQLRYTTQQQPEPTSAVLLAALEEDFTDNNVALAYTRRIGESATWRLAASYAPSQYFLGNVSYLNRDSQGAQVELEAVWTVHF